jgi:hypothetical protein
MNPIRPPVTIHRSSGEPDTPTNLTKHYKAKLINRRVGPGDRLS